MHESGECCERGVWSDDCETDDEFDDGQLNGGLVPEKQWFEPTLESTLETERMLSRVQSCPVL